MHSKSRFGRVKILTLNATIHQNPDKSSKSPKPMSKAASLLWTTGVLVLGVGLVIWYFRIDRNNRISDWIQSFGVAGVLLAILLMALFCIIPVPSEFLMVMNMKVFGVWWGILYTWIGAMLGAFVVFLAARYLGARLLRAFVSHERLLQVDAWVSRRGALGLLLARLVPLPFIVVNYTAGVMKSVSLRDYVWTTGVGLVPYDLGAALIFLGFSKRFIVWLVLGGIAVVGIWVAGYFFNRHVNQSRRWAH